MKERQPITARRLWAIIGICAFVLADIALVVWALYATHHAAPSKLGPIPTFTNYPSTPTGTPTPVPTATPAASQVTAAPRFLAAVSATEAYRATPGSCTGAGTVIEKTTDAGATWQPLNTTTYDFHTLMALYGATDSQLSAVTGTGDGCTTSAFSSFTGGQFWQQYPNNLATATYIDPADRSTIHTAAGAEDAPCDGAVQIATTSNSTAVLCPGVIYVQPGAGAWSATNLAGALAITPSASGYTVAATGVAGCTGIELESLAVDGSALRPLGCNASVTSPTAVTVAQSGSALWLWSGTTTAVSLNAGVTW